MAKLISLARTRYRVDHPPPALCLEERQYEIAALSAAHPPVWHHPLKQEVHLWLGKNLSTPAGQLRYTRWAAAPLPDNLPNPSGEFVADADFYSYPGSNAVSWHVNFADPRLFVAYGSGLLAQDEMQVLEHPVLGSLRESLMAAGLPAVTRENGRSTPVLITGAPRQCELDVFPDPDLPGRERGLYGNRFQQSNAETVLSALRLIDPPTITNLIAMSAPTGDGIYSMTAITDILGTAFTGMRSAVLESARLRPGAEVEVHTGYWGCGAFGGSKVLMTLLQILAARLAGIDRLFFHCGSQAEIFPCEEGRATLERLTPAANGRVANLIEAIHRKNFKWGTSDGN